MDACIIECTTLHKLKQAFLEAGTAYIENVLLMQFCLAEIHLINMFCAICIHYFKWSVTNFVCA